ncbi:hypothetical protein [Bacillus sp. B-jedd]|uniref:hypothetical protein n=1 Tax=Bacillus sp. B-jedd TaxID=1476857 RepID=UPI00051565DF|nr:hypothetical protein [Bacillus sp. B-jedd]CEG29799.1 hypothetical protein BN1002_04760 [Bacillus sp. B-jedd]
MSRKKQDNKDLPEVLAAGLNSKEIEPNQLYEISIDGNGEVISHTQASDMTVSQEEEAVFIYCGPSSHLISRYSSYKNGYPLHLQEHLEKCPVLKSLFIVPELFLEFEKSLSETGSVESIWFDEVKEYFRKVVS